MIINNENYEYYEICEVNDFPAEGRMLIELDDTIILILKQENKFCAISGQCSHDACSLFEGDVEENSVVCPCHGARFNILDGKVLSLPATKPIQTFPVRISGQILEIGLKK